MNSMIYDPLEEYRQKFKKLHLDNTNRFFEELVRQSGVDIEENRKTVRQYDEHTKKLGTLRHKLYWMRILRMIMVILVISIPIMLRTPELAIQAFLVLSVVFIPLILLITPKIQGYRSEIELADEKASELLALARKQMEPLNALFTEQDALRLLEDSIPLLSLEPSFSAEQEANMVLNFDFCGKGDDEQSVIGLLAGNYNENPFLFENRQIHEMGTEVYHGYKTISWTEEYTDSEGETKTRTETETLHATLKKPKPKYHTQTLLHYCSQGGPDLTFSRGATHLDRMSEIGIERYVKRGEKQLKRMTDRAIRENRDFVSMSNTEFEVLFHATNRTDEVQFRTLFTPLAQINMVKLVLSQVGYGDDFNFCKLNRTNRIISEHSLGRAITLFPKDHASYSYEQVRENFIGKNAEFFKAVYFDFAPVWAIPLYQERPAHSLDPVPKRRQKYASKEWEALANAVDDQYVVHPQTATKAILKCSFVSSGKSGDRIKVTAYSYSVRKRVTDVSVHGGDGYWHDVPVEWKEYIPLKFESRYYVGTEEQANNRTILAKKDNLCIFN